LKRVRGRRGQNDVVSGVRDDGCVRRGVGGVGGEGSDGGESGKAGEDGEGGEDGEDDEGVKVVRVEIAARTISSFGEDRSPFSWGIILTR
jgi:hypothetical protein